MINALICNNASFAVSLSEMFQMPFNLQSLPILLYIFQILSYFENVTIIFQYLCYFASATIAFYVIFRSLNELLQRLCNILMKASRSKSGFDENEWLENNQKTDDSKDSKPTVFDLLVELTDKINQQKVQMTNQQKVFSQNQDKMEAKIQQIVEEQKCFIKTQKKEEKLSLQHHRDIVNNQEQSDMKLENLKDELISQQKELKKLCLETRSSLQNQIKQQGVLQNLVLDLKPSNENQQGGAKKENELNNECNICMERPLAIVLKPCGHTLCFQCAKKLKECHKCRGKISGFQKVFID